MSQKRIQQIERRIDRIKRALLEIGPMRPGSLTRQYKDPQGIRKGGAPPDRDPQAVQTVG